MRQNLTIISILICILLLGIWGQYELNPEKVQQTFLLSIYQIFMLFMLEGDWTNTGNLPWQLELTRFLAPLASVTGILFVLTRGTWIQLSNFFVRYRQDQVVVAGLGDRAWQFISSCRDQYKVVVVEMDKDNIHIERARMAGMSVIVGDILEPSMFDKVNLLKAKHLVAHTDNDGVNVEMAIKARNYLRSKSLVQGHQLRIHIHVKNTRISQRLANYPKFFDNPGTAEINFFSVYELNARILFNQYPPERFASVLGRKQVHIALFFFGRLAEHILLESSRICHFANGSRVRFTIFDEHAEERERELKREYPHLEELIDLSFITLPIRQAGSIESIAEEVLNSITEHVVCLSTDEESFALALVLRSTILKLTHCNAPILVRMQQSSGLAQLLESNLGLPEVPDGLYPFGMLDETLHYENILSDRLDSLARILHGDYVQQNKDLGLEMHSASATKEWTLLSEPKKKDNRLEADHLQLKLRAIRCVASEEKGREMVFSDEEAITLARMEQERWRGNLLFEGWKSGPDRIESAKVNPYAVPWDELPDQEKQRLVMSIKRLPELLRNKMGLTLKREFVIGITGHRLHKLDSGCHLLRKRIETVLKGIVDENPGRRFIIASPLAEGADRLVAKIAMEKFSMSLRVPLPLPYEIYQTDFTSDESIEEFKELVGKAAFYFELPMKFGTLEQLALLPHKESNSLRDKQYALVGAYLTERSDELIAIYDESPESGVGGTGQVVRWRTNRQVDDEYANNSFFFSRPDMREPIILAPT